MLSDSLSKERKLERYYSRELNPDEAEKFFKENMSNPEDLLGPQFCSLCDRNIG